MLKFWAIYKLTRKHALTLTVSLMTIFNMMTIWGIDPSMKKMPPLQEVL